MGNDSVSGIYFASANQGWITTQASVETNGGAVFNVSNGAVASVLFNGFYDPSPGGPNNGMAWPCGTLGDIDLIGIVKTADGFGALTDAGCSIVSSHDGGQTFQIEKSEATGLGGAPMIGLSTYSGGATMVGHGGTSNAGFVETTTDTVGPNANWTTVWDPSSSPTTPDPIPAGQCVGGPSSVLPLTHTAAYVSPDGRFLAYGASPNGDAQVCVSTDGGQSFFPHVLQGLSTTVADFVPIGVVFASATTGIVFWGDLSFPGESYIYQTTDSGAHWAPVAIPTEVASKAIELNSAFFAPDGLHGWIVGYDGDDDIALMIRTSDGGAHWEAKSGDLATKITGGVAKLRTGFALDQYHIWVGGDYGLFGSNAAGGD
jgi:hypothetical protein